LLREGDSTRVAGYLPFYPERYQFYSLSHTTPIGSDGMSLTAHGARVETRQRGGASEGEATLAGLGLSYPLVRSNRTMLTASASVDGIDSDNYFLDVRFGDYRSRAIRLGATWSRTEATSGHAVSAVVSRGVDMLGAKAFTGFSETRFTKVNLQAVAVQGVSRTLSLKLSAKGQYSGDRLPVTERFSLGGRGAGMAFRLGVLTAEQAVAGGAELTWAPSVKSPPLKNGALFIYADGATAHAVARPFYRLAAQDFTLASVGGGVRIGLGAQWRASAEVALPVKRPDDSYSRKARFFFGVGRAF
ncbi:MAG TPA: ShlB/FhaC/HecB family hemolysin secretion/activation protein, partial [Sphingobium sp.]|nr:ShlB/FhaC/HecB family hemolysin secretion/activation protein [Sphingobium sp.]